MKTFNETKEAADKNRQWFFVDATDKPVGRVCSRIAAVLRGKNNVRFAPHTDTGDFVIVINADKIKFTGKKLEQKKYFKHTGYIGGIKSETAASLLSRKPEELISKTVYGMLPKSALSKRQLTKLKVYQGNVHPHQAQTPKELTI